RALQTCRITGSSRSPLLELSFPFIITSASFAPFTGPKTRPTYLSSPFRNQSVRPFMSASWECSIWDFFPATYCIWQKTPPERSSRQWRRHARPFLRNPRQGASRFVNDPDLSSPLRHALDCSIVREEEFN